MKGSKFLTIFATSIILSCSTNSLDEKTQTIELSDIAWACDCANWARPDDIRKYNDAGDTLAELSIFIEPADSSLVLPDAIGYNGDLVEFTGQFYQAKGFPKGYSSQEMPEKSRVFRYTNYRVIESNYKFAKNYKD